jgi:hypothetical protein
MKKIMLLMTIIYGMVIGSCLAAGLEADLTVGSDSIEGGFHLKRDLANGFWRAGGTVLYTDDDDMEYKWAELDFSVGSETLAPGMTCDVGIKGILGDAEDNGYSGDVGAVAFAGRISYLFPRQQTPVPVEVFAGLAYAPEIMSFRDTEEYLAFHVGVGVRIVQNASIIVKYNSYDVDMESGARTWELDDSNVRLGLVMRF